MNKRKADKELEELQSDILECPLCNERYYLPDKKPLCLTCGHTYCK